MKRLMGWAASLAALMMMASGSAIAQNQLKIASPQRGSWEGAIPELGKQAGIFKKHGLDLEILYTSGGGETLQVVISGAVDIGLSAGTAGVMGAFQKNAPIRIIGASSTGSQEVYWYTRASSPVKTMREAHGKTISYSTTGASSHITALRFISEYGLKDSRAVASGDVSATITQVMSGQVDIGWCVAPFNLEPLRKGEIRLLAKGSDILRIRGQTIRVQIANARVVNEKRDLIKRYLAAYRETVDWMYSSDDAVKRYMEFSGLPEASVRQMLAEFIPKESLQIDRISGIEESMQDAVQFKFLTEPLNQKQLADLIQIDALKK
jgi:NitT/TauT family transport system substrate-binding protein